MKSNRGIIMFEEGPERPYGNYIFYNGGDTYAVVMFSYGLKQRSFGPPGPDQDRSFLAYMKEYGCPRIHDMVKDATFLTPVIPFAVFISIFGQWGRRGGTKSVWNRFDQLPAGSLPDGLILIGDAVCGFNPVYGQGVTVASMEAVRLGEMLQARIKAATKAKSARLTASPPAQRSLIAGFATEWQKEVAKIVEPCWELATGSDRKYPTTIVEPPPSGLERLLRKALLLYNAEVQYLSYTDPIVQMAFHRVLHQTSPLSELLTPPVLPKVLWSLMMRAMKGRMAPKQVAKEE